MSQFFAGPLGQQVERRTAEASTGIFLFLYIYAEHTSQDAPYPPGPDSLPRIGDVGQSRTRTVITPEDIGVRDKPGHTLQARGSFCPSVLPRDPRHGGITSLDIRNSTLDPCMECSGWNLTANNLVRGGAWHAYSKLSPSFLSNLSPQQSYPAKCTSAQSVRQPSQEQLSQAVRSQPGFIRMRLHSRDPIELGRTFYPSFLRHLYHGFVLTPRSCCNIILQTLVNFHGEHSTLWVATSPAHLPSTDCKRGLPGCRSRLREDCAMAASLECLSRGLFVWQASWTRVVRLVCIDMTRGLWIHGRGWAAAIRT